MQLEENATLLSHKQFQTKQAIQHWLSSYLSEQLLIEPQEIDIQLPLEDYGLDSVEMLSLTGALEDWLGYQLSPDLVYEYPTIKELARHLAEKSAK